MDNKLKALRAPLKKLSAYKGVRDSIKNNLYPISITGCLESEICHFIDAVSNGVSWRVIIVSDEVKCRSLYKDYRIFDPNVLVYPAKDIIFYNANIHGNALSMERLKCLEKILSEDGGTVITSISAGIELVQSLEKFKSAIITVNVDKEYDLQELSQKLIEMGYERQSLVQGVGEFSIRGEILDIYPPSADCPLRIDFFDTMVESIKEFDVDSQRSIDELTKAVIFPASELILSDEEIENGLVKIEKDKTKLENTFKKAKNINAYNNINNTIGELKELLKYSRTKTGLESYLPYFDENTQNFFDYFDQDDTLFFIDNYSRCMENLNVILQEFSESMVARYEQGYILKKQLGILKDDKYLQKKLLSMHSVFLNIVETLEKTIKPKNIFNINVQNVPGYNTHFDYLVKDLQKWQKEKYRVLILSASHTRAKRIVKNLEDFDIKSYYMDEPNEEIKAGNIMVTYGYLNKGFLYPDIKFVVVSESDIYGAKISRKAKKKKINADAIQSFNELSVGDYVIHENHGICIYDGIEKIRLDGVTNDYIKLNFKGQDRMFLPISNLNVLQKYANKDADKPPKVDSLNSVSWKRKKARVRAGVRDIAKDLVKLYSVRSKETGYKFGEDTVWQKEFEEMFPYDETDDQLEAISAVKQDMESNKIMDRLICGDVGFGKTEVALRACFKCVMDGKQAAILVPTTILCRQHYNTFVERIGDFPLRIAFVSRLHYSAENKRILEQVKKGEIDVIIGTHRLLSKDVVFKNLGLLVVDEEQRFGVTHKEKIKVLRKNVDVLSLSATPIPRTLHMSLIGIRDMSLLEEPPVDRLPIQTFVLEKNDEMIREAICREVGRGGQVYYIFNRIEKIDEVSSHLNKLVPDINIAYTHGRMSPAQIERIMMDFISGNIDVLVSTTIIETGIDIPNVNTIIIDNAEKMGLSQLYQLRGRVGRSNRIAYAFLLYHKDKMLSEVAEKRLNAIREFSALGSGIRVAMRDLEIRGAGNLLGAEQSGHMGDVGYDLYCKMLDEAIKEIKNEINPEDYDIYDFETTIEIKTDAFIPAKYIKSEFVKLDTYKRISMISSEEDLTDMLEELKDRFGEVPQAVKNLLNVVYVKSVAHKAFVNSIVQVDDNIKFFLQKDNKISSQKLEEMLQSYKRRLSFVGGEKPYLLYTPKKRYKPSSIKGREDFSDIIKLVKDLYATVEQ
ncbi:MAG: transcription-repair coupling factor [Lachnospiraceae bacterium]|nr:transcription-repair coupling factor [Lachnospiraceae bacterium]